MRGNRSASHRHNCHCYLDHTDLHDADVQREGKQKETEKKIISESSNIRQVEEGKRHTIQITQHDLSSKLKYFQRTKIFLKFQTSHGKKNQPEDFITFTFD